MVDILTLPIDETIALAMQEAWQAADEETSDAQKRGLRQAKARAALCLGIAEAGGAIEVLRAAALWSDFADAACGSALKMAYQSSNVLFNKHRKLLAATECDGQTSSQAQISGPLSDTICGIAVIAMGKHGARELNYSSDIDLVVIYDPEAAIFTQAGLDPASAKTIAVNITKDMIGRLSDQTKDGYVFRTDLRLRPDPGASAAAVSINAAEAYYEAYGQNWERAAYIKARCVAGDPTVGADFLKRLRPFVWRRSLDYAAIEDIHSIKRQIHAAKGGAKIEFHGHDLKTGRGGIREIEFIVQTQQLILGGRDQSLRPRATVKAIAALVDCGALSSETGAALDKSYRYLRRIEHRIQMISDEQTHKIPETKENTERLAFFLGAPSMEIFETELRSVLQYVHTVFSDIFGKEQALSDDAGSLSFTGVDYDTATLATLREMGFVDPNFIADRVKRWHAGEVRSTRSIRARELLTKFTPSLLRALASSDRPDDSFLAFDRFLQRLPGGLQIFSLFINKPQIFDICIRIMTFSPYLGRQLADRTNLIEAMTDASWPRPMGDSNEAAAALELQLGTSVDFEQGINAVRRWAHEAQFEVTAALAVGRAEPDKVGEAYTSIAVRVIEVLLPLAMRETERKHGKIDGNLAIIGLGRLGAVRMSAASDVDLVFVYDCPSDAQSTGPVAIGGPEYFTKLVRRFLTAMTAPTEEGLLYDVDMMLRPSGRAGPAAVSIDAFLKYYASDAWVWERMALIKARVVATDTDFADKINKVLSNIQATAIDEDVLLQGVRDMHARLNKAKPAKSYWDIKSVRGGTADIDFILEFLALKNAQKLRGKPLNRPQDLIQTLGAMSVLSGDEVEALSTADRFLEIILQLQRAAHGADKSDTSADPNNPVARAAPKGALAASIMETLDASTFAALEERFESCLASVKVIFDAHIGGDQ